MNCVMQVGLGLLGYALLTTGDTLFQEIPYSWEVESCGGPEAGSALSKMARCSVLVACFEHGSPL